MSTVCNVFAFLRNFRRKIAKAFRVSAEIKLRAAYDVILIFFVEFGKITAPAPYPHDKVGIIFGVRLRVKQSVAVDGVDLDLMPAAIDKRLDKRGGFLLSLGVSEHGIVDLDRERTAVADRAQVELRASPARLPSAVAPTFAADSTYSIALPVPARHTPPNGVFLPFSASANIYAISRMIPSGRSSLLPTFGHATSAFLSPAYPS